MYERNLVWVALYSLYQGNSFQRQIYNPGGHFPFFRVLQSTLLLTYSICAPQRSSFARNSPPLPILPICSAALILDRQPLFCCILSSKKQVLIHHQLSRRPLVSCPRNKFQNLGTTVVPVQSHLARSASIFGEVRKRPWTCPNYGRYS